MVRSSGAISTANRVGDVFFRPTIHIDSFEALPIMYVNDGSTGSDYAIARDTNIADKSIPISGITGDTSSLKLTTRTTTPAVGDLVQASFRCHLRDGKRIRVTGKFRFPSDSDTDSIKIRLQWYDGTNLHTVQLIYKHNGGSNGKLQYIDSAGNTQDVTNGAIQLYIDSWHEFEIECDFDSDEYISVRCDHLRIDMKDISSYKAANGTDSHFKISLGLTTQTATSTSVYFDQVIVEEIV